MSKRAAKLDAGGPGHGAVAPLTELERSILTMVMQGLTTENIAAQTGYSEHLIALIGKEICNKANANSLAHAVAVLHSSDAIEL